jgi:superfamily I DNA and/or RNA helicase
MNDLQKSIAKAATGKKKDKGKIKEGRAEMKALRKEARKREEGVVKSIIQGSNVVFSTCVGAGSRLLTDIDFDLVVIDEAAQVFYSSIVAAFYKMSHFWIICKFVPNGM